MRVLLGVLVVLAGCSPAPGSDDGGASDAGTTDSGVTNRCPPEPHDYGQCGVCVETLVDYCARTSDCGARNTYTCTPSTPIRRTTEETGCGYVRFTVRGDVGDVSGRVYEADSGTLLYVWSNGALSVNCRDANYSGDEPTCASWSSTPCQ